MGVGCVALCAPFPLLTTDIHLTMFLFLRFMTNEYIHFKVLCTGLRFIHNVIFFPHNKRQCVDLTSEKYPCEETTREREREKIVFFPHCLQQGGSCHFPPQG